MNLSNHLISVLVSINYQNRWPFNLSRPSLFDYMGQKLLPLIHCVFLKDYSLISKWPNQLGLYNGSNQRWRSVKEVSDSIHLSCQQLVTLIHILNQWVKYGTHLLSKRINHIMVTFVHRLSHRHHRVCGKCWHCLGTKSHPYLVLHSLTRVTYGRARCQY